MSSIGQPADTSLLQAAQAQQMASKARDREKAATESGRRFRDLVDLRVAGAESEEAVRNIPGNDSEQAEDEHQAQAQPQVPQDEDDESQDRPRIDVKA